VEIGKIQREEEENGREKYRLKFTAEIISINSLEEMTRFQDHKGLGIFKFKNNGKTLWGHSGQLMGFECITAFDPAVK
jgi:hypothetical protein